MESTREQRELKIFGTTTEGFEEFIKNHVGEGKTFATLNEAALSILSDSQEEIELGQTERARTAINRAKWLLDRARRESTKIKWIKVHESLKNINPPPRDFVAVVEGVELEAKIVPGKTFPNDTATWKVRAGGGEWRDVGELPDRYSLRRGFERSIQTAPRW